MQIILKTLRVAHSHSNIIVLTDASDKDHDLKHVIIDIANNRAISIYFLILHSSNCVTAETSLQHYRDIASETNGIVVESSVAGTGLLKAFTNVLHESLSDDADKTKRSSIKSVTFYASIFTKAIDILFTKFNAKITVTTPEGNTTTVRTLRSIAFYSNDNPSPGLYVINSNGEFEYSVVQTSSLDVFIEHYGMNSTRQVSGKISTV